MQTRRGFLGWLAALVGGTGAAVLAPGEAPSAPPSRPSSPSVGRPDAAPPPARLPGGAAVGEFSNRPRGVIDPFVQQQIVQMKLLQAAASGFSAVEAVQPEVRCRYCGGAGSPGESCRGCGAPV